MRGVFVITVCLTVASFLLLPRAYGQNPMSRFSGIGAGTKSKDTLLQHRVDDSIIINFRFLDSSRLRKLDSSIYDFTRKYPLPKTYIDLGNFGTAARNLEFTPMMKSGWDPGWHAYDLYLFKPEDTRFYTTTKPYTELGYMIGTRAEQMIDLIHTQNIGKRLNLALEYRLINAPGTFQNQTTSHNNYRFNGWYQSQNKRYQAFLILVANKLQSGESGGIRSPGDLDSLSYSSRYSIPTWIGGDQVYSYNPFLVNITTGSFYSQGTYMLRQLYDIIGKKDSVVTDTTVTRLFYPKFRAEHTISYSTFNYRFVDQNPDTAYYVHFYNFISTPDTIRMKDYWTQLVNDLSLYEFPDSKNPQQFFKAGISLEDLKGNFAAGNKTLYNVFAHGEYRNKTRNQKWDIEAFGKFYVAGYNAADYNASISLKRLISPKLGFLQVGFQNVNRTTSFAFDPESSYGFGITNGYFKKENNTNLYGSIEQPKQRLKITVNYFLMNNYAYFQDYYKASQQTNPFNVIQLDVDKVIVLYRHWIWRMLLVFQEKAGASPINMPLLVTHNQIGYEGKLGFRNLNISFGGELRYFTPYTADGYSPLIGQFFIQNNTTIREKLPDITAYLNFRIRSFTAYVRAENLNTMQFNGPSGFGFTNNNFVAPNYPYPGLRIRMGIFWSFIN